MKTAFWLTTPKLFEPSRIDSTPFGGAEISALNLAKTLGDVSIFGNCQKSKIGDINYYNYSDIYDIPVDTMICVRADRKIIDPRINSRTFKKLPERIILWTGDAYDQPLNQVFHDVYTLNGLYQIVVKSEWQKKTLLKRFPLIRPDKMMVIYNGVLNYDRRVVPTEEPKFIYASTAYRGLHLFLKIWPEIKKKIPQATLDCYCSTNLYMDNNPRDAMYEPLYAKIAGLKDVKLKAPIPQKQMLGILPNYYAMLYPNCGFIESSCGIALEAMSRGVPIITSNIAGLAETTILINGGILIRHDPERDESNYIKCFVDKTTELWQNKKTRKELSLQGLQTAKAYYWTQVARRWRRLLGEQEYSSVSLACSR